MRIEWKRFISGAFKENKSLESISETYCIKRFENQLALFGSNCATERIRLMTKI